jgi:dCTP deaminase
MVFHGGGPDARWLAVCWEVPKDQTAQLLICPHSADHDFAALSRQSGREVALSEQGHVLEPFSFLLGWTLERIQLPHTARLAPRVEGKCSLARLGLGIHVTAPTVPAGFGNKEGDPGCPGSPIQLEIWNVGRHSIILDAGLPGITALY